MPNLLTFWFSNEDLWFNCSSNDDQMITQLFEPQLRDYQFQIDTNSQQKLETIILLDQISRHVDRVLQTDYTTKYYQDALELSQQIFQEDLTQFKTKEICFILMPMRHSNDLEVIKKSLDYINNLRQDNKLDPYLRRFHRATVKSLSNKIDPSLYHNIKDISEYQDLFCPTCMCNFSHDSNKFSITNYNQEIIQCFIPFREFKKITISLSGGVDSMVSAFILKQLNFEVQALMINYNNRKLSFREVEMVSSWCNYMEIPIYVRTIKEINRTQDNDRDFYEEITKNMRFNAYKYLNNPVVLGHNKDDCLENIFSNIKKGRSYNNLFGMDTDSILNNVKIIRPMLRIAKKDIFEFANKHNIPYLVDSTPKWSERGRTRDILVPSVDSFDPLLLPGIYSLAEQFKNIYTTYTQFLEQSIVIEQSNSVLKVKYIDCYDLDYWKIIFRKCFSKLSEKFPSNKSITNVINNLQLKKSNKIKMIITQNRYSIFENNIMMLYPNFLRKNDI